jgi:hypothetical protein
MSHSIHVSAICRPLQYRTLQNVSSYSLRRLEIPLQQFPLDMTTIDVILSHFPELEVLKFTHMKNPDGDRRIDVRGILSSRRSFPMMTWPSPIVGFSNLVSSFLLTNLKHIRTLIFSSSPTRTSSHLALLTHLSSTPPAVVKAWGRRNPNLREFGMYHICWRRSEGGRDDDWGWEIMAHESWMPRAYVGREF